MVVVSQLHLLHQEDDLDPDPASHSLLLAILSHVGSQLHLLRIDECSSDILSAPKGERADLRYRARLDRSADG